jgi:hypothetical protein
MLGLFRKLSVITYEKKINTQTNKHKQTNKQTNKEHKHKQEQNSVDIDLTLLSNDTIQPWETLEDGTAIDTKTEQIQTLTRQTQTQTQTHENLISSEFWPSNLFLTVIIFGSALLCLFALVICIVQFFRIRKGTKKDMQRKKSAENFDTVLANTDFLGEGSEPNTPQKPERSTKVYMNKETEEDEKQPLLFLTTKQ